MILVLAAMALALALCGMVVIVLSSSKPAAAPTTTNAKKPGSDPATTTIKAGSSLPPSCKITGNVFGNNRSVKGGIAKRGVYATYHFYSPQYDTGTLACADIVWKWPNYQQKLLMYPWTAYCLDGRAAWNPGKTCGRCLRVKNTRTGQAIIVRAVDSGGCSGGKKDGLDLDPCAFNAIDSDRKGVRDGHLIVDVEEVDC